MRGRHLLTIGDLSAPELTLILDTAAELKRRPPPPMLAGKTLALVFEKPSLRTRVSFGVAMRRLGGAIEYLGPDEIGLGTREAVKDVARVLCRYVDVIAARTMTQATVEELAAYSAVPVINALSDTEHPCQALADLLTIREHCGRLDGIHVAYIGDGNNVAASLAQACGLMGRTSPSLAGGVRRARGAVGAGQGLCRCSRWLDNPGDGAGRGRARGRHYLHRRLGEHGPGARGRDPARSVCPLSS